MVKIKICGLTRPEDVAAVNRAMPDYAGFVFAKNSKRRVTPELAAALAAQLSAQIISVGVFVNAELSLIRELYEARTIRIAQLHGGESGQYIAALTDSGIPVIQAIRELHSDLPSELASYHLYDGAVGGSGEARAYTLRESGKPVFLAGGISAENLASALELKPYAIDVSSGAESDGVKDAEKIKYLVDTVRRTT